MSSAPEAVAVQVVDADAAVPVSNAALVRKVLKNALYGCVSVVPSRFTHKIDSFICCKDVKLIMFPQWNPFLSVPRLRPAISAKARGEPGNTRKLPVWRLQQRLRAELYK